MGGIQLETKEVAIKVHLMIWPLVYPCLYTFCPAVHTLFQLLFSLVIASMGRGSGTGQAFAGLMSVSSFEACLTVSSMLSLVVLSPGPFRLFNIAC